MPFFHRLATCLLLFANVVSRVPAYKTLDGILQDNDGNPMRIKGISWFGFETQDQVVDGLWARDMKYYMDLMAQDGFNVIRIPFCAKWILYQWDAYPDEGFVSADPQNHHKQSIQILDTLFDMAEHRNMRILLDLHRLNDQYISELWYDPYNGDYNADKFFETWYRILDRYKDHKALWGVDLLNEPHGPATWGTQDPSTDWKMFAESAIFAMEKKYPNAQWMYIVEGVEWGKQLAGADQAPLKLPPSAKHRLAYSAHNYGRSVIPSLDIWNVEALHGDWDAHFGFLADKGETVITGEWGGRVDLDHEWMETFVDYLQQKNMTNTFFWSLGPNSGDVAGYLKDDWVNVDEFKREITHKLQPNPSPRPHAVVKSGE